MPTRAPDAVCDLGTRPEMALIYRLSGDRNPLHAEPAVAKAAGYPRPIMHGLGTFGIAGHAVLKTMCGYDPDKLDVVRLPVLRAGVSRRDHPHRDVARRQCGELPRPRRRTRRRSPSTTAAPRSGRERTAADLAPIREAVRALCADFPGEYWRALDRERAYPDGIRRRADQGRLSRRADPGRVWRQRPHHERGRRDPGGDPGLPAATAPPATRRCTRWARCCGTAAPSRRQRYLPAIASGELRLQAFGVTEPTSGTDTLSLRTTAVREGNDTTSSTARRSGPRAPSIPT